MYFVFMYVNLYVCIHVCVSLSLYIDVYIYKQNMQSKVRHVEYLEKATDPFSRTIDMSLQRLCC